MSWDLPDDWRCYFTRCEVCGERRHPSGDTECACERGEPPRSREDEGEAEIDREIERREEPHNNERRTR